MGAPRAAAALTPGPPCRRGCRNPQFPLTSAASEGRPPQLPSPGNWPLSAQVGGVCKALNLRPRDQLPGPRGLRLLQTCPALPSLTPRVTSGGLWSLLLIWGLLVCAASGWLHWLLAPGPAAEEEQQPRWGPSRPRPPPSPITVKRHHPAPGPGLAVSDRLSVSVQSLAFSLWLSSSGSAGAQVHTFCVSDGDQIPFPFHSTLT